MATPKQTRYLQKLKFAVGLKRYNQIKKRLKLPRPGAPNLSTADASRLIGALLADIERQKQTAFNFALRLHAPPKRIAPRAKRSKLLR